MVRTQGLTKRFGGFTAVRNLDLSIRRGTIHALIGPNGAGKTTVFNLLTKFLPPTGGKIFFDGEDITALGAAEVARRGMVRSFQISAVFPHLTVRENLRIALQRATGLTYRFWLGESSLSRLDERIDALLDSTGLAEFHAGTAADLSYGRKRMLEIATTLALAPQVMLLDEPMSGLGQEDIARVAGLIRAASAGRTVVMVEHNLSVVKSLSDRITVLARGEVLAEGVYDEVAANPDVIKAYLGAGDD